MLRCSVVLLIPFFLCAQNANIKEPAPYNDDEVYKVYSAVLAMELEKDKKTPDLLMLSDTTWSFNECLESRSETQVDSAIADYKSANQKRWRLQRKFALDRPYTLLSKEDEDKFREPQHGFAWKFSRGSGIYRFSAVGFSPDKTIAFVEMEFVCGGLCGHGEPHILEKKNGKWREYDPPMIKNPDGSFSSSVICFWNY